MNWYLISIIAMSIVMTYMIYRIYVLQSSLTQSLIDNKIAIAMLKSMKEELEKQSELQDESNESFIKFLSDSREWAFKYIEDTINTINNVIEDCRKEMNKPRIADLNTPAFLAGIISKLSPIVESKQKDA